MHRIACVAATALRVSGIVMSKDHFDAISGGAARDRALGAGRRLWLRFRSARSRRLTGGATTASTFRVEAGGRRYLLRMEGEPSPLRNPHQYVSMRIAAEAGIAPEIHYIDEAARVAVIDFIEQATAENLSGRAARAGAGAGRVAFARAGHAGISLFRQLSRYRRALVRACAANRSVCRRPA